LLRWVAFADEVDDEAANAYRVQRGELDLLGQRRRSDIARDAGARTRR
jgi:hypothetical protein